MLAHHIALRAGKPLWLDALRRLRATPTQGHRKRKERQENVRGGFSVSTRQDYTGKILVLIDDVLTTSATAEECARALLKAGAKEIHMLTLSRVKSAV